MAQTVTLDRRDPARQQMIPNGRRAEDKQIEPAMVMKQLYAMLLH